MRKYFLFLLIPIMLNADTERKVSELSVEELKNIVSENDKKIAIMPMYVKTDSQGEFVFDWSWADAFYRNGVNYYPKLVCSIPYTPASGPRLSVVDKEKTQDHGIKLLMTDG